MTMNLDTLETKGGPDPLADPGKVRQELDGIKSKLEEVAGTLAATPKSAEVKSLGEQLEAVRGQVGTFDASYKGLITALEGRIDELQTTAALVGAKNQDTPMGIKALANEVFQSDIYKTLFDAEGAKSARFAGFSRPTPIASLTAMGIKAADPVSIADVSGVNLQAYRPGVFTERDWAMDLLSRLPKTIVKNATSYVIPRETTASRYGAITSTLSANLDGDPTAKSTATFTDVDGFSAGMVVRFYNATGGVLGMAKIVSIDTATKIVTFVTDSLTWDATATWRVTSENYGYVAEEGTKPSGWVGTTNLEYSLRTLPTIIPTTVQALNTIQGLQAMIEGKLPLRFSRNMSYHIQYGVTASGQLQGFRTYAGADAQSYSWSGGTIGDNRVDALFRAINMIPWTAPISVIMSQVDLPALLLLKGGDGHYIQSTSFGALTMMQVGGSWFLGPWELVFDYSTTSGDFTAVNFSEASEFVDQDTASLLWGYIDDDFAINVIRARYEATVCHAIKSGQNFVIGEWDNAPGVV